MALPSSGQISFNDVRFEFSQSQAPKYNMGDWTSGAWLSQSFATNRFAPVNLMSSGSGTYTRYTSSASGNKFNPYLNNSMSAWYGYNHTSAMDDSGASSGEYLYIHTGFNHCYPSSMIPVDIGTTNGTVYISISGSADYLYENVYVYYGKPWKDNGEDPNIGAAGPARLITASGHFFYPYTGDIDLEFNWDYRYTASMGQYIYFVIYGDYCFNNSAL
jgi:hypothetical protein